MPYVSHEQIIERKKDEYYLALRRSQATFNTDHESIESWVEFFLSVVNEQGNKAVTLLESEHLEDILSSKQLTVWKYISSVDEASAGKITEITGIARPTVNQALEKLVGLQKIKRMGQGRATRYKKIA